MGQHHCCCQLPCWVHLQILTSVKPLAALALLLPWPPQKRPPLLQQRRLLLLLIGLAEERCAEFGPAQSSADAQVPASQVGGAALTQHPFCFHPHRWHSQRSCMTQSCLPHLCLVAATSMLHSLVCCSWSQLQQCCRRCCLQRARLEWWSLSSAERPWLQGRLFVAERNTKPMPVVGSSQYLLKEQAQHHRPVLALSHQKSCWIPVAASAPVTSAALAEGAVASLGTATDCRQPHCLPDSAGMALDSEGCCSPHNYS